MAGRGKAPKTPAQRRRTNTPAAGEWITLSQTRKGRTPALAAKVSKPTRAWWARIWHTPQATQWQSSDIEALTELAVLRDQLMAGKLSIAPEVRLRSDSFGLTPKGRQERRWLIAEGEVRSVESPADELEGRRDRRTELRAAFEE